MPVQPHRATAPVPNARPAKASAAVRPRTADSRAASFELGGSMVELPAEPSQTTTLDPALCPVSTSALSVRRVPSAVVQRTFASTSSRDPTPSAGDGVSVRSTACTECRSVRCALNTSSAAWDVTKPAMAPPTRTTARTTRTSQASTMSSSRRNGLLRNRHSRFFIRLFLPMVPHLLVVVAMPKVSVGNMTSLGPKRGCQVPHRHRVPDPDGPFSPLWRRRRRTPARRPGRSTAVRGSRRRRRAGRGAGSAGSPSCR